MVIELSEPVKVAQAQKEELWGYFQFPGIAKAEDGTLVVTWSMKKDSHETYGVKSTRKHTPMMSKDGGTSWVPLEKVGFALGGTYHVRLNNGKILEIYTPKSKDIREYKDFPREVYKDHDHRYYTASELPQELKDIYFNLWSEDRRSKVIYSTIDDPGLLRYAIGNLMPVVWWGNIKQQKDNSLVAGIYPGYYLDEQLNKVYEAVTFYQSADEGKSWKVIGKIPFKGDANTYSHGEQNFDEPAFEILDDSTYLCVMRTGSAFPMYRAFSHDRGYTWTRPEPFTPNGVKSWLMKLGNGTLLLASGRPGIQLRFSLDGSGKEWIEPIDLIPFMKKDGTYVRDVSCGYVSLCEADHNSFYVVYSDFTSKNEKGETRKSILFRKITVKKK